MADLTLDEVSNRVLQKLFVLVAGETAEAEDEALVQTVVTNINEQLRQKKICYWENDATPEHLTEDLVRYYACFLAEDYMDEAEASSFVGKYQESSLAKLRELTAFQKKVDEPARNLFF